jgi:hypothetical protein
VAESYGLKPDWTRVNIFLPVNDLPEILAANDVIALIKNNYGGLTSSLLRPYNFEGIWWDDIVKQWVSDKICWLIFDIPSALGSTEIDIDVELIRLYVLSFYTKRTEKEQKEVWIMVHQAWKALSTTN